MSIRDAIARSTRRVHATTSAHAEDLIVDDRTAPGVEIPFRGVVDRNPVVEAADEVDIMVERIRISAALGGDHGLQGVPVSGIWRVKLPVDIGGVARWCKVAQIITQDDAAVVFEVLR